MFTYPKGGDWTGVSEKQAAPDRGGYGRHQKRQTFPAIVFDGFKERKMATGAIRCRAGTPNV